MPVSEGAGDAAEGASVGVVSAAIVATSFITPYNTPEGRDSMASEGELS
jgi:hypothetical protein